MLTSMVFRQILLDAGDIPRCFIPGVPGLKFLHRVLHEGQ